MKVVHVNTTDLIGGAAKLAYRMHKEMLGQGIDSTMWVGLKTSNENEIHILNNVFNFVHKIPFIRKYLLRIKSLRKFSKLPKEVLSADVIHLHNLHGNYFDLNLLRQLKGFRGKIVMTLHDMWIFTANEPHTTDNYWYKENISISDISKMEILTERQSILDDLNITYVLPSKWLNDKFEKSFLGEDEHLVVNNAIDREVFFDELSTSARERLNLPLDKKIVLFQAQGGKNNKWKGGNIWEKLVEDLGKERSDVLFIEVGRTKEDTWESESYFSASYTEDIGKIRDYFNAANILCFPSQFENFSITLLEALSCGLPVVAFDVGGNKEIIEDQKNGYVVKKNEYKEFYRSCLKLLREDSLNKEISKRNSVRAEKFFRIQDMIDKYLSIYKI